MHKDHDHWVVMADDHWREYLPTMYKEMQAEKSLVKYLHQAAKSTARDMDAMIDAGQTYDQAWEIARSRYLLLTPEPEPEDEELKENLRRSHQMMLDSLEDQEVISQAFSGPEEE